MMAESFTSEHRICSLTSPLEKDALLLRGLRGGDGISKLFRFELDLVSENSEIDFDTIIGKPVCITAELGSGGKRYFHGLVARFSQQSAGKRLTAYRAEVVPWLWCLTRSTNCRIFQEKSVPDIVKEVCDKLGFSDYELDLTATYDPLPYCVQYGETDFNFVSRLLEEAGIAYYFRHEEKQHSLVLFDSPSKNKPCPGNEKVSYSAEEEAERAAGEVGEWLAGQEMRTGGCALRDYDFEDPGLDLGVDTQTSISVGGNDSFETYDYPGNYKDSDSGRKAVLLRMEAEETAAKVIQGSGTCSGFTSGFRFDLKGHYRDSFNDTYLITTVEHELSQSFDEGDKAGSEYHNRFTCIPHAIPYRPLPTARKPRIHGAQTAVVVGAAGEEVDVDEHGRVVVQFHWDRQGKKDDKSSCRVRVAQHWAGKNWGAIFHPRIDQEVIVEFLEGDPDRPIITGRVYNGEQKPPYDLPANKTQSGIKSRSSKGAGTSNFNEIRLEDKKGSEEFFMQAEKDMSISVKNNYSASTGVDGSVSTGENFTESVGNNKTVTVAADHSETVSGSQTLAVTGTRSRTATGTDTTTAEADQSVTVGGGQTVKVSSDRGVEVGGGVTEKTGGSHKLTVGSDTTVSTGGTLKLEAGAAVEISSPKIVLNGATAVEIVCGGTTIKFTPGTLDTSSAAITTTAGASHDIKGAIVKHNC
jgi:type VI secretion system secreted protein VgrG